MKVLIAGGWQWPQYEEAFADALVQLGHEVVRHPFGRHFGGVLGRYQEAVPVPAAALWRLNWRFLTNVKVMRPDVVLFWRNTHILPATVRKTRELDVLTVSHNHDDPFGTFHGRSLPWHQRALWFWYRRCLRHMDVTLVNRQVNIKEAKSCGATNVDVLMPYFVPERHRPMHLSLEERDRFACDVVFVGHYEADGREDYIGSLVDAGVRVRLFGGPYWSSGVLKRHSAYFGVVRPALNDDYAKALCGAEMCLSFLSKMNRDTYTSRCFEIPACGRLLLCERTAHLEAMFADGNEAVFFSSREELREKTLWLLRNPQEIRRIAEAGRRRVYADGHDVVSRASAFVRLASEAMQSSRVRARARSTACHSPAEP